jgi:BolA family transcriptional regulator, general stress-responsive regulator
MIDNSHRIELIKVALQSLNPSHLEVIDESYKHIGHEGAKTGLGHFKVVITSPQFVGNNRITNHKAIYATLGDLMHTDIHALSIVLRK